ncbi:MAG: hypothetical protein R3284_03010 [Rubricoccaceae bacterium]|nr:hypothetical protein [Rubricoccaceae bacterium]
MRIRFPYLALSLTAYLALSLAACDSSIQGQAADNRLPETELSVRVTDLRETLGDGTLVSTVEVSWSGTDPDGFIASYDFRFYDEMLLGSIGPEENWTSTTSRDTTVLLPIPPGESTAAVVVEVRAVDNDGLKDPTPARTIFPIRNSPPEFRFVESEAPPDTTWPIFSFTWVGSDPDGDEDLAGIEVAFNDTLSGFTRLPADIDFVTFRAEDPRAMGMTTAQVFLGRAFQPSSLTVPNLVLDGENVVYMRAVDRTDTTSTVVRFPRDEEDAFVVKRVSSDILLVNDYRKENYDVVMPYHEALLDEYVGAGNYDEWYLAEPFQTGSTIVTAYSENLPANPDPVLTETLRLWRHIYWVSTNATNRSLGNNLPLAANFIDGFLTDGGSIFVNVAIQLPTSPDDNLGNGALSLLPLAGLLTFGEGSEYPEYDPRLDLFTGAAVTPQNTLPNGVPLPALRTSRFVDRTFSYPVDEGSIPLYSGEYTAYLKDGGTTPWEGPSTVASFRNDGRVALFALPLLTDLTGSLTLEGTDGDPNAPKEAIKLILDALGFAP